MNSRASTGRKPKKTLEASSVGHPVNAEIQAWRMKLVLAFLCLLSLLIASRLSNQQVLGGHAFLAKQGEARTVRTETITAHRGMITDRNGEPLAVSTPVVSLWANPQILSQDSESWQQVADVMGWSPAELQQKMAQYNDKEFMYLKRHMSPAEADVLLLKRIDGLYGLREYKRFYPAGEVTAHLVGFTNIDDKGQEGIELAFEDELKGSEGKKRVLKDRMGRIVKDLGLSKPEQNGLDMALSVDLRVQYFAHSILKDIVMQFNALGGSAVVLDVHSNEVLAIVNSPSFNPNNRIGVKPQQMRNRAMVDVFEPGSTMKPLTMLAGLESGKWKPGMQIDTNPGYITVQGKQIKDHNNYGVIDLTKVISKSSQVGTVKIAMSLPPDDVRNMFHRFGLGQATGTGFPGESVGVLPTYRKWRDLDRATLAFGHGVSVTALQLAVAYSVLANEGVRKQPSLLRVDAPVSEVQVLSPELVQQILPMMEAVTQPGGTATRARVPAFRVAGKTGTVHKLGLHGYSADRYVAMFAGFAPVSNPRYVIAVMIDEPSSGKYYGGEVAAPVFARLMQGVLQLMGEVPDDPQPVILSPENAAENKKATIQAVQSGKQA